VRQKKEKKPCENIYEVANKFVPRVHIPRAGAYLPTSLGDKLKNCDRLFTDIRDYTTLSEQMTPDENFILYAPSMKKWVPLKHNGFINQYLGDAIMAIFLVRPPTRWRRRLKNAEGGAGTECRAC
jgi:hypothetical protein